MNDKTQRLFSVIHIISDYAVKARSESLLKVRTDFDFFGDVIISPFKNKLASKGLIAPHCLSRADGSTLLMSICNLTDEDIILRKDYVVGKAELLSEQPASHSVSNELCCVKQVVVEEYKEIIANIMKETASNSALDGETQRRLKEILTENCEVFARNKNDLGFCSLVKHDIVTKPVAPINLKARRVPMALEDKVDEAVNDMLQKGVIRPSTSPWNSPIVLVRKKDNEIRFCLDFRALNSVTFRPVFPLPDTKEVLDHLNGSIYFSSIDVSNAFHQCEIREKDKEKTAFSTRQGQWEFNRMAFGLCGATATWQRLMHEILKGDNWRKCLIYVDDVLVFGKTTKEHLENLSTILKKLKEAGIKLSPSKCDFFKRKLKFLGHVVSQSGIETDPDKIEKVKSWKLPKSKDDLRTFLAFCGYYRKFVRSFAQLTIPLERLILNETNKTDAVLWDEASIESFEKLKEELTSAPLLGFPIQNGGTLILDTDASFDAIGAVLSQIQNGKEVVIEYGSRKLSKSELKYCVTRKEMLAVVHFVRHFRHYLLGARFVIRTDHKALEWMLNWEKPNSTQYCKWIADLQQYNFEIRHRPGREHKNADALSRLESCGQCELSHPNPQRRRNVKDLGNIYSLESTLSDKEIERIHSLLGHPGKKKMYQFLKENYKNFKVNEDKVNRCVGSCLHCVKKKVYTPGRKNQPLHITATTPFEKILIDIAGPLQESKYGYRYILGVIDVFSRYPMIIPLRETTTAVIFSALFSKWISIFGIPREIVSDNAKNLNSEEFMKKLNDLGIKKTPTCPYYPKGKGTIERLFRTVKERLFVTAREKRISWIEAIPYVEFGLRTTINSAISMSPSKVIFGRNIFPSENREIGNTLIYQYKVRERMKELNGMSTWYPRFKKDELVMVKSTQNKFMKAQYFGPAKITSVNDHKMYTLEYKGKLLNRHETVLKPYEGGHERREITKPKERNQPRQRYPNRLRKPVTRFF